MDMNLSKYFAFVTTVEYGSFTKAAEVLNYSQSAVSRMINDLETEWNTAAFPELMDRKKCNIMEWTQTNPKSRRNFHVNQKRNNTTSL